MLKGIRKRVRYSLSVKMNPSAIILASASPRRRELMKRLSISFQVIPSGVAESEDEFLSLHEICQLNAYRKARDVAKSCPDYLVIGADTLVCLQDRRFGKPADLEEADEMLAALSGQTHEVVTGVCLIHLRAHRQRVFAVNSAVKFRRLSAADRRHYLENVNPLDKAGAYAIQEKGDWIVEEVLGSYANVVGLPLERLVTELREFGFLRGETFDKARL